MSKKENEREVTSLLARIRESLRRPWKNADTKKSNDDPFEAELSERLGQHLNTDEEDFSEELQEGETEAEFAVDELEIVADGTLDPEQVDDIPPWEDVPDSETVAAAEQALFSDMDGLLARMTPEQRARFEAEMNETESVSDEAQEDEAQEMEIPEAESPEPEQPEEIASEDSAQTVAADESPVETSSADELEDSKICGSAVEQTVTEAEEAVADQTTEEATQEEGDIYTTPDEDEDYDLPESEAFRALETRMTAEQRAQFEQAMLEAREAEREEKAARREAARRSAEEKALAEANLAQNQPEESAALADESTAEAPMDVAEDELPLQTAEVVEEYVPQVEEEPEEISDIDAENIEKEDDASLDTDASDDHEPQATIFMAASEEDEDDDMPTIKVGAEPSVFTLVVEPEPEPEPEPELSEEEMLAALLSRMTPEQLARVREEMLADVDEDEAEGEASETVDDYESLQVVEETVESVRESEEVPEFAEKSAFAFAPAEEADDQTEHSTFTFAPAEETTTEQAEDAPEWEILRDEAKESDTPSDEETTADDETSENRVECENGDVIFTYEVSDYVPRDEEEILDLLSDPEKLEELMSRLTPEQAAQLRELLREDEEEDIEETVATCEEEFPAEEETVSDAVDNQSEDEDIISMILNDPEKLDELMSRLSPEQAEQLRELLRENESETEDLAQDEVVAESESVESEDVESVIDAAEEIAESPEMVDDEETVLSQEEISEERIEDDDITQENFYEDNVSDIQQEDLEDDVAYEFSQEDCDDEHFEDDPEDEEDPNIFEINEDMTDEEIALMLGLGYEKELTYTLGDERIAQVKKRTARENARDPELANAYAYEGEEYRNTDQNEHIRYRYDTDRRRLWVRLIGTSFFALLLFLYECCGLFQNAFGDIFDAAHYPVIAIMAGWQLLIFAAVFSRKQLFHGLRSAFMLEPDHHAMTAVAVTVVMFNNILMAIVFKGSTLYLYNFPAAICLLCSVLCDLADVSREMLTFDVVSSEAQKYVSEPVTLTAELTDMPITPVEEEANNPLSSKNAIYVRRVGFVKNYFRRTNRKTHHAQILNFVFLPLLSFAAVMGVITALIGNGIAPALSTFVVAVLLCMPLSYTVIHTLPLYYEARRLHKQGCAIVGEGTVEECNQFSTVVFEDKDIFPPTLIKTKGLKLFENNLIYSVILKISLLFREIGGPINDVLDLDKEELKRFLESGRAGALTNGQVILDSISEEGVTARLSDGSFVVAGSAAFLESHGVYVRVSDKDQKMIDSGEMSILFLAFDGKLGARFYVDYRPDPEFETLAGMLHEDGFRVAIRTLDPGIHGEMIAKKCPEDMPQIGTVRAKTRSLTSRPGNEARVDGGLVCSDDPRKMLLPLRSIRNLRRLNRFALRLYAIALLINMVVAIVLTVCSAAGFMSSLFVSLYMLVWLATSLIITALFLNK